MDLYESCESGNEERVVELLLHLTSRQERPEARFEGGRTALHAACIEGQRNVVRLLLGESAEVFFTSRSMPETEQLLADLASDRVENLRLAVKPDAAGNDQVPVPVATVRLPPSCTIANRFLLDGQTFLDDFGNSPLQCVSCFGSGASEKDLDDALEITRQLLLHGDQTNVPKLANQWTPLHWTAFNGFHDQTAMLLDPETTIPSTQRGVRFTKTQFAVPLVTNHEDLFAADVAGRRALKMASRMRTLHHKKATGQSLSESEQWTLRLDHIQVLHVLVDEFLDHGSDLASYATRMNERVPWQLATTNKAVRRLRSFTGRDVLRYGQHLLYWMGTTGSVDRVRKLLALRFAGKDLLLAADKSIDSVVSLDPLFVCCCEEGKRQSALHAACARGQVAICELLLARLLQLHPHVRRHHEYHPATGVLVMKALRHLKTRLARGSKLSLVHNHFHPRTSKNHVTPVPAPAPTTNTPEPEDDDKNNNQSTQLEVADFLADWCNYRDETPLFLACLHFQSAVVSLLQKWLSPSSLKWELNFTNVEGASIQRVANLEICALLGLDPVSSSSSSSLSSSSSSSSLEEYVLVFNGDRKKQFKESVIDTLQEESAQSPALIVTRAGQQTYFSHWTCQRYRNDYVMVGVSDQVLYHHAETLQLKIKHRDSNVRSRYQRECHARFEPFHSLQRQQVVFDVLRKSVNLKKHLANGNLLHMFPLHDERDCRNIARLWLHDDRRQRFVLQPFSKKTMRQYLFESRTHQFESLWPLLTYFGEKHTFYYAFLQFFSVWLFFIAVPGVCLELWLGVGGGDNSKVLTVFAVWVALWASVVVEGWKRKKSELSANFGSFEPTKTEENVDFFGDFRVKSSHSGGGGAGEQHLEIYFPKSVRLMRIYSGVPVLLGMALLAVLLVYYCNTSASKLERVLFAPWCHPMALPYMVSLLNAVLILVLDSLYSRVALVITAWENHRTVWQYESQLATKLFWFKFLNAFTSLFWIAFVRKDRMKLRQQLLVILSMRQLWITFFRYILPLLIVKLRWRLASFRVSNSSKWFCFEWYSIQLQSQSQRQRHRVLPDQIDAHNVATDTTTKRVPSKVLVQQLMESPDFLLSKQLELILQFGYVTMFVCVVPSAPGLALLFNVLNLRLDVLCATQVKRRGPFDSETEISSFLHILEFMSFAAVSVNCAVLFFTTRDFDRLLGTTESDNAMATATKVWLLVALEHLILGTKALIAFTLDDAAAWVTREQQKHRDAIADAFVIDNDTDPDVTTTTDITTTNITSSSGPGATATDTPDTLAKASKATITTNGDDKQLEDLLSSVFTLPSIVEQRLGVGPAQEANDMVVRRLLELQEEHQRAIDARNQSHQKLLELQSQLEDVQSRLALVENRPEHQDDHQLQDTTKTMATTTATTATTATTWWWPRKDKPTDLSSTNCFKCFVCEWLTEVDVAPTRKCFDCHLWLCLRCDEVLHWDELPSAVAHFRVHVPTSFVADHRHELRRRLDAASDSATQCSELEKERARLVSLLAGVAPFDAAKDRVLARIATGALSVAELRVLNRFLRNFQHFPFAKADG